MALFASGASSIYLNTTDSISVNFSASNVDCSHFQIAGQGSVQVLNLVSGFITALAKCWLMLSKYSVAFKTRCTC